MRLPPPPFTRSERSAHKDDARPQFHQPELRLSCVRMTSPIGCGEPANGERPCVIGCRAAYSGSGGMLQNLARVAQLVIYGAAVVSDGVKRGTSQLAWPRRCVIG